MTHSEGPLTQDQRSISIIAAGSLAPQRHDANQWSRDFQGKLRRNTIASLAVHSKDHLRPRLGGSAKGLSSCAQAGDALRRRLGAPVSRGASSMPGLLHLYPRPHAAPPEMRRLTCFERRARFKLWKFSFWVAWERWRVWKGEYFKEIWTGKIYKAGET